MYRCIKSESLLAPAFILIVLLQFTLPVAGNGEDRFSLRQASPVKEGEHPAGAIVKDGTAHATIILPEKPGPGLRYAASDLQDVLFQITGVTIPVTDDTESVEGNRILLGKTNFTGKVVGSGETASLDKEDYIIRLKGRDLALVGGGPYGVIYACSELYHRLGARWYMPGELGACIPNLDSIVFEKLDVRESPSFKMRWVGKDLKWNLRNRSNLVTDESMPPAFIVHPSIYHSQRYWLPDNKYFEERPEFFALIDGKRSTNARVRKLCNSNPLMAKEIAKNMARDLKKMPEINLISLTPTDGRDGKNRKVYCQCKSCRALDKPDYELLDKPIPSDRLYSRRQMVLYNRVARELEADFPNRPVLIGAYANYTWPPEDPNIQAHRNLAVIIARYEDYCYAHPLTDLSCKPNHRFKTLVNAWRDQTSEIYFYEYYHKAAWLNLPWFLVHSIREDIPYYKRIGVDGLYTQYNPGCIWSNFPNMFVTARLLWDHDSDVDSIMDEFYRKFYGQAAEPMKRYHQTLESMLNDDKHHHIGYARKTAHLCFSEDVIKKMKYHLNEAVKYASKDIVKRRLDRMAVLTEYTDRLSRYYRLKNEAENTEGQKQNQKLLQAYEVGEALRVDVRDNPKKYQGIAWKNWLVNDISEGRTIRNMRKKLVGAGLIQPESK